MAIVIHGSSDDFPKIEGKSSFLNAVGKAILIFKVIIYR